MEGMITLADAARVLAVHPRTLARWVKEGKVRAARLGRRLLFAPEELRRVTGRA